jgi:hypothetical protein
VHHRSGATSPAGVSPDQVLNGPVITIGDRCVIEGAIVGPAHQIGDAWTGHSVCHHANHGYTDPVEPVGRVRP